MFKPIVAFSAVFSVVVLLAAPGTTLGRGGGGGGFGGGGHGGGGGFGGGHFGGAGFGGHGWGGRGYGWGGWGGRGYYGWGGRGYWGYGGWGYPYYGLGLGLGVGLGYGLGYGAYGGYYGGYGYPYGYGYGGYGHGYGGYGYGYPGYGYGNYGYDPYGVSNGAYYAGNPATDPNYITRQPSTPAKTSAAAEPAALPPAPGTQAFLEKGETAFRAGDYKGAVYALRHAAVDDPQNGVMTLLLGQALFASGQFDEAAGATQAAMRQLPKEQWGLVVNQYRELYGDPHDYTRQLRVLESAIKAKPNDPGLRFLAGFHYAHLGFAKQAIDQLDRVLKAAPRDEMARQLREEMQARLEKPPTPAPQAGPALLDERES